MSASGDSSSGNHVNNASCFLELVASELNWNDLSDDLVMEVGCGSTDPKLVDLIVERFPSVRKVIAVDNNSVLIHYLHSKGPHPKIEYCRADIENWSSLKKWEGQISKLVSRHCFHLLKDQITAFQNVYHLLQPGGEAAFLFCLKSGFVGWHTELAESSKWKHFKNENGPATPATGFQILSDNQCADKLKNIGFSILRCRKEKLCMPFESEEAWKEATYKLSMSAFNIPDNRKEEFKEDLFAAFMRCNGKDQDGHVCLLSEHLTVLVKKPVDSTASTG